MLCWNFYVHDFDKYHFAKYVKRDLLWELARENFPPRTSEIVELFKFQEGLWKQHATAD